MQCFIENSDWFCTVCRTQGKQTALFYSLTILKPLLERLEFDSFFHCGTFPAVPRCVIYSWATSRDPLRLAVRSFHELRVQVTPSRWSLTTSNWAVKNFIMAVLEASLIRNCSLVKHEWHVFAISLAVTWVLVLMRRAQSFAGWGEQPRWLQGNTFTPHTPQPPPQCFMTFLAFSFRCRCWRPVVLTNS